MKTAVLITVAPFATPRLAQALREISAPVQLIALYADAVYLALADAPPRDSPDLFALCLRLLDEQGQLMACPSAAARRGFQAREKPGLVWTSLPNMLELAARCERRVVVD